MRKLLTTAVLVGALSVFGMGAASATQHAGGPGAGPAPKPRVCVVYDPFGCMIWGG